MQYMLNVYAHIPLCGRAGTPNICIVQGSAGIAKSWSRILVSQNRKELHPQKMMCIYSNYLLRSRSCFGTCTENAEGNERVDHCIWNPDIDCQCDFPLFYKQLELCISASYSVSHRFVNGGSRNRSLVFCLVWCHLSSYVNIVYQIWEILLTLWDFEYGMEYRFYLNLFLSRPLCLTSD